MVLDIFKSVQLVQADGGMILRGPEYYTVNEDID